VEAFVYLRVRPGRTIEVRNRLTSTSAGRRSVVVVGDWDVLCLVDGPDLGAIGTSVLSEIQTIEGVVRTFTAPVVPPDRLGVVGFGGLPTPQVVRGACYVHIEAEAGAAAGLYERLSEIGGVSGAAVLGGRWDLLACVEEPWEIASGIVLEKIQALPGVRSTSTLVSVDYEEPEEDRDQFSSWS
jgi:DNA-binding Lrp family transcriptional regulator